MKHVILKKLWIAAIALLVAPSVVFAQKEKDKAEKDKDKEVQNIIITRTGDVNEKIVIELDGEKVKINGKDINEMKDVKVHVNTIKSPSVYFHGAPGESWNFNMNTDAFSLFSEDENRAMLGVTTENDEKGAEIRSITSESAAEKSGLKKGDIIIKVDDTKIESADDVTEAIRSHKPGDKVNITYLRDGKEAKTSAELGKWKGIKLHDVAIPRISQAWGGQNVPESRFYGLDGTRVWSASRPRLGLSIQDTEDGNGVMIIEVEEESAAAKAGLQKDDIIIEVDGEKVEGTQDVSRAVRENMEKSNFSFKVKRDGKTQNIEVKFPKKLKTTNL